MATTPEVEEAPKKTVPKISYTENAELTTPQAGCNNVCPTTPPLEHPNQMQKGIRLVFLTDKNEYTKDSFLPDFDTEGYISGFASTTQDALVDTMTSLGSDTAHPNRGSAFQDDIRNGAFASVGGLVHIANFASVDVKTWINGNLEPIFKEGYFDNGANSIMAQSVSQEGNLIPVISTYRLTPSKVTYDGVEFEAYFTASDGTVIGTDITSVLADTALG